MTMLMLDEVLDASSLSTWVALWITAQTFRIPLRYHLRRQVDDGSALNSTNKIELTKENKNMLNNEQSQSLNPQI
jgi:hypothetical protein